MPRMVARALQHPRQALQRRLRQLKGSVPVPVAVAVGGTVALLLLLARGRRRRSRRAQVITASKEPPQEGAVVDLQLPLPPPRAPFLPMLPPRPLKVLMADISLPVPLSAVWTGIFTNESQFLAAFHAARSDLDFVITPWTKAGPSLATRTLQYVSPLSNPLGPRLARNTEVLECTQLAASGFVLQTRCTTEGVPFAGNFANYLQWVGTDDGRGCSRLVVTGECRFHTQVWGPLRGKVESESIKGMALAYAQFSRMVQETFGGGSPGAGGSAGGLGLAGGPGAAGPQGGGVAMVEALPLSTPRTQLAALLGGTGGSGQGSASTATVLALVLVVVLLYRLSLGDVMAVQLLRRLTGQALTGVASAV